MADAGSQLGELGVAPGDIVLEVDPRDLAFTGTLANVGGCDLYAFVPLRGRFEELRDGPLRKARAFNFALGASTRTATVASELDGQQEIEIRSVERVLEELELPWIDLLRIDGELACEILEQFLNSKLAENVDCIHVRFDASVGDARREAIRERLAHTHGVQRDATSPWERYARIARRDELAVTAMIHNEGRFLGEWMEYHLAVGVTHFWIYDDASTDNTRDVLTPYCEAGLVELIDWPSGRGLYDTNRQGDSHRDALRRACGSARWLALIDADEYLLPMRHDTVGACLEEGFSAAAAVYANWRNFGPGGVYLTHEGPSLMDLTACAEPSHPANGTGKSIVRPERVRLAEHWNGHHPILVPGAAYMDGDGEPIASDSAGPTLDAKHHDRLLRINHYPMRDEAYFRSKRLDRLVGRGTSDHLIWEHYESFSMQQDHVLTKLIHERHPDRYRTFWARAPESWPACGPFVTARLEGAFTERLFQLATACAVAWDNNLEPVFPDLVPWSQEYRTVLRRFSVGPQPAEWVDWRESEHAYLATPIEVSIRLIGRFRSERHFARHDAKLRALLAPLPDAAAQLRLVYGELLERGDTVGVDLLFGGGEDVIDFTSYLEQALAHVSPGSLFVIATDDSYRARSTLPASMQNVVFIDADLNQPEALYLLSACHDNIVGGSTLGWWAAWLNQSGAKRVIRPGLAEEGDLSYPPGWVAAPAGLAVRKAGPT